MPNPYDFDAHLFKIEQEDVVFYGINTKRYVLYRKSKEGEINVLKASSHDLGRLLNSFSRENNNDWHKEVRRGAMLLHYDRVTAESMTKKYGRSIALSMLAISGQKKTRFENLNRGRLYEQQIKPFNLCIVGSGNDVDGETGKSVKSYLRSERTYSSACTTLLSIMKAARR